MSPPRKPERLSPKAIEALALKSLSAALADLGAQVGKIVLPKSSGRFSDFQIEFASIRGDVELVSAEVRRCLDRYGLLSIKEFLSEQAVTGEKTSSKIVLTDFVSSKQAEQLRSLGVNFADAVGNVSLVLPKVGLSVGMRVAVENPFKAPGRPLKSLSGEPSALVVRGLLDAACPIRASELIERTGVSRASAYRTLDFLESQGFIKRSAPGVAEQVNAGDLIREASQWLCFGSSGSTYQFIAPRGLDAVLDKLRKVKTGYAVTGSAASAYVRSITPTTSLAIYSTDFEALANELGLREVPSGGDVLINIPDWEVVYQQTQQFEGLTCVSTAQIALDLVDGPGRSPQQGEAIIEWIERNKI